jgi:hypothetical protein
MTGSHKFECLEKTCIFDIDEFSCNLYIFSEFSSVFDQKVGFLTFFPPNFPSLLRPPDCDWSGVTGAWCAYCAPSLPMCLSIVVCILLTALSVFDK